MGRISGVLMNVSIGIMGVRERMHWIIPMMKELGPDVIVSFDDNREGVWPNARRSWKRLTQTKAEWCCLLQDDVLLAKGFREALGRALSVLPKEAEVVAPYASRKIVAEATDSWVHIRDGVWGAALCMRRDSVLSWLKWERAHVLPDFKHDDSRISMWLIETGRVSWVMVPSIVEHLGDTHSTLGNRSVRPRVASRFIHDATDTHWPLPSGGITYSAGSSMTKYRKEWLR